MARRSPSWCWVSSSPSCSWRPRRPRRIDHRGRRGGRRLCCDGGGLCRRRCARWMSRSDVLETAGSVDNLTRVKAGKADVAIVQTGVAGDVGAGWRSLAGRRCSTSRSGSSIAQTVRVDELQDIAGRRVAIGPEGSGVRALATLLLERGRRDARDLYRRAACGAGGRRGAPEGRDRCGHGRVWRDDAVDRRAHRRPVDRA